MNLASGAADRANERAIMSTIHDVAELAHVSIATVSRVLNGSTRVSDDARDRVRAAASKLDYWPNSAARSLTTQRTHTIGVLLPDLYGEFYSELIRGIDHSARASGLQILLSSSHSDREELLASARSMRGRIDGLVLLAADEAASLSAAAIRRRIPVVLLNPRSRVEECRSVSVENFEGALEVVRHLFSLGHRTVATLRGPLENADAEERLRGFRAACAEAGFEPGAAHEIAGDFTESSGFAAAHAILRADPRPTAVFVANDSMAIGLLSALRAHGIDVPGDLAVAGFDDIAIARYMTPSLTTVRIDAYRLGERAVQLLAATESEFGGDSIHEVHPARLVIRRSCGANRGESEPNDEAPGDRNRR